MATTIPALRGKFGETEYWLTTMKVGEFIRNVQLPKDLPGWEDLSIEERYQRDISLNRVRKELAPYFATDGNRFSGALVLAVLNHEQMEFEPLMEVITNNRNLLANYRRPAADMGFLTLEGGEILVPLDGQHRAKALEFAINGTDDSNKPIPGMKGNPEIANDQVSVILIRFETTRARRIFNKINRYARPTTKGDNLITDDDDALAVMTRELASEDGIMPARLVNINTNTLNKTAPEFTTLATFYDANVAIVNKLGYAGSGTPHQMDEAQRELVREDVQKMWGVVLKGVDLWAKALSDPEESGDKIRIEIREQTLLGKPVGQTALINGFLPLRERCKEVSEEELCSRINNIDWDANNEMWHGVLMNPNGRVMSGKNTVNRASEFIAHLGGAQLSDDEKNRLLEHIYGEDWEQHGLPEPVAVRE